MPKKNRITRFSKKQAEDGMTLRASDDYTEITLSRLRSRLSDTMNRVRYGKECILVTDYGKKLAQLLPVPEE